MKSSLKCPHCPFKAKTTQGMKVHAFACRRHRNKGAGFLASVNIPVIKHSTRVTCSGCGYDAASPAGLKVHLHSCPTERHLSPATKNSLARKASELQARLYEGMRRPDLVSTLGRKATKAIGLDGVRKIIKDELELALDTTVDRVYAVIMADLRADIKAKLIDAVQAC